MTSGEPSSQTTAIWFPAKRYGWGWGRPVAWQGWVFLIAWNFCLVAGTVLLAGRHWVGFAAFVLFMSAMMIVLCYAKGERPRWRWGN